MKTTERLDRPSNCIVADAGGATSKHTNNMKKLTKIMVAALMLGSSASFVIAQPPDGPPPDGNGPPPFEGGQPGGPGMRGHRPPPSPLIAVLDANRDGIIDSNEIANASAALMKL